MSLIDTKISACLSWQEFCRLVAEQKTSKEKGDLFERLTQLYLQTATEYRSKFKNVWWCNNKDELPTNVRAELNLPIDDEGIDLVCETYDGTFWSVQSKYREDTSKPLNTRDLSKFSTLSFVTARKIVFGLVVHTSTKKVKKSNLLGNYAEIGLQHWLEITDDEWNRIIKLCKFNRLLPPKRHKKRGYQEKALDKAEDYFLRKNYSSGKLIMPCGTGKSLLAYWIAQRLEAKTIILAVPSLALLKQSLKDWTSEYLAEGIKPDWLAICSDVGIGMLKREDSTVASVYETGIPVTTKPDEIEKFVSKSSEGPKLLFTTYDSSRVLAESCSRVNFSPDLLIADEAHKTAGSRDKKFASLLFDGNVKIKKRVFMTATERIVRHGKDDIVAMNDVNVYGHTFYSMSFKEAIDKKIISDYKIITLLVNDTGIEQILKDNPEVLANFSDVSLITDSRDLGIGIALGKAYQNYGIKHTISFHSTVKKAENFANQQNDLVIKGQNDEPIINFTVSSKKSAGERAKILSHFAKSDLSLVSNAKCLTEGVNIPAVDCVTFVDPRRNVIDIVQAAGRAMRLSEETGKTTGYIAIPIIIPRGETLSEYYKSSNFKDVLRVITSLSTSDERITAQLKNYKPGKRHNPDDVIIIDPEISKTLDIDISEFNENIFVQLWRSVGKANWMPFDNAKEFAQRKNFKTVQEFRKWVKTDEKPADFPASPEKVYEFDGFIGFSEFLGTGTIAAQDKKFRSFRSTRSFVRRLKIPNSKEWRTYAKSDAKPADIPATPDQVYIKKGWTSWSDFLGTGEVGKRPYRSLEEARKFVRPLKFKQNKEYKKWVGSGKAPIDIPYKPDEKYKTSGWIGWGDYLGTNNIGKGKFLPFEAARAFVRKQGLKSQAEWSKWVKTNKKPKNIPADARTVYANKGWISMGDWLGTGTIAPQLKTFKDFYDAREFAQNQGLASVDAWREWSKSGNRPDDIPGNPEEYYKNDGWISWPDWLGKEEKG